MSLRHRLHGLLVLSHLPLPAALDNSDDPVDVAIVVHRHGPIDAKPTVVDSEPLAEMDDPVSGRRHTLARTHDGWLMDFGDTARVQITDADADAARVAVWPGEGVATDLLSLLVAGPMLTAVSMLRHRPLLHASSVVSGMGPGRGALAFAGPTGAGKSTMARLLVDHTGATLLSDDTTYLEVTGSQVLAHSGTRITRLRTGALTALHSDRDVGRSPDGRLTVGAVAHRGELEALARAVIVPLLSPHFPAPTARVLRGAAALAALIGAEPLAGVLDADLRSAHFRRCAELASLLPVVRLESPWGRDNLDVAALAGSVQGTVDDALAAG